MRCAAIPATSSAGESSSGCFLQPLKTEKHEKRNENSHAGKQVPTVGRGERLHHQQGCGHYRGIPGGTAGTVHADTCRVRVHALHLGKSGKGFAELQYRTQTGLLHRRGIQAGYLQGRPELSEPQFRAAFQRAAVFAAYLLPVPYENHEGTQPDDQQFQCTYKGIHYPQGNAGQGNRHPVHGVLRTIRTHRKRQRPATYHPPDG